MQLRSPSRLQFLFGFCYTSAGTIVGDKSNAILCSIAQMSNQKVIELRSASKGADKQTPAVKETVSEQQCETASSKFVQYQAAPIVENNQQVETAEP